MTDDQQMSPDSAQSASTTVLLLRVEDFCFFDRTVAQITAATRPTVLVKVKCTVDCWCSHGSLLDSCLHLDCKKPIDVMLMLSSWLS